MSFLTAAIPISLAGTGRNTCPVAPRHEASAWGLCTAANGHYRGTGNLSLCAGSEHSTRHVIGYLCCLAFITLALTFFQFFPDVVRNVEASANTVVDGLKSDPTLGPAARLTVHAFGESFSPALVLGHFVAIMLSPIGLIALLGYILLSWMLPAR